MKKAFFLFLFGFSSATIYCQLDSISVAPNYLEDQLYFGITYNSFSKTPSGFIQDGFAYGLSAGFIKDIPFNKRRNFGIALGVGYSYNNYIQNIIAAENSLENGYSTTIDENTYTLNTNSLEFPFEIRWRTSTLDKYKFWRVYTGVTFSYVLSSYASGESTPEAVAITKAVEVEKFQYALSLAAGYGTWNFYVNYSLTPFFKKNTSLSNGEDLDMSTFRLGLMFYIF